MATSWVLLAVTLLFAAPIHAAPADDQYAVASDHYRSGRWKLAADELQSFLQNHAGDPRAATVRFLYGETLVQLRDFDRAQKTFADFRRSFPQHQFARQAEFRQGEVAYLVGDYPRAKTLLEQFQQRYPNDGLNAYSLAYLGDILLHDGATQAAEKIYAEALRRFPESVLSDECRFGLGRCYQQLGDGPAAMRFYQFLAINEAGQLADDALLQMALLQYENKQFDEAVKSLTKLEGLPQRSPLIPRSQYWRAKCLIVRQDRRGAREVLQQINSDKAEAELAAAIAFELGECCRKLGDPRAAQREFEKIGRNWPDSKWCAEALEARVAIALDSGNNVAVEMLSEQFLDTHSEHRLVRRVRQYLGRSLLQAGRYDRSAQVFRELLAGMPDTASGASDDATNLTPAPVAMSDDQRLERRSTLYYLALAELGSQQFEACVNTLDKLPQEGLGQDLRRGVLVAKASALMGTKRYAQAVEPLESYLTDFPQGADAVKCRTQLIVALVELKRLTEVDPVFEQFRTTCEQPALIRQTTLYLAEANAREGRKSQARRLYITLADKQNPPEVIAKALDALARLEPTTNEGAERSEFDGGGSQPSDNVASSNPAAGTYPTDESTDVVPPDENFPVARRTNDGGEIGDAGETGSSDTAATTADPNLNDAGSGFAVDSSDKPPTNANAADATNSSDSTSTPTKVADEPSFGDLLNRFADTPEAARAAIIRAANLERNGPAGPAIDAYRLVYERFPDSQEAPQARLAAAQLLQNQKQLEAAEGILRETANLYPKFERADAVHYLWAWALVDLNRADDADTVFQTLADDHSESTYWADATYRLAERAARRGDLANAASMADRLIESPVRGGVRIHACYLRGQVAAAQGQWEVVESSMTRLLSDAPDSNLVVPAEYWQAEAAYRLGHFEDAEQRYRSLSQQTRGRQESWLAMITLRRAQILARKHRWDEAQELAESIAERFPNFRQQYEVDYLLGRCHGSRGEFSAARTAYERVVRSPDGGRTETAAMAQWMIGETYFHQKDYSHAIRAYHRVETLFAYPRWQAAALLQAGKCYEMQAAWRESVRLYAQLLKDYPESRFQEEASRRLRKAKQLAATTAPQQTP